MTASEWSKIAESVKLLIPREYDPYQASTSGTCFVQFDLERRCFLIISEDSGNALDIIDSRDIVGAAVDVELSGSAGAANLAKRVSTASPDSTEDSSPTRQRADNEPKSDVPKDTKGCAILEIYAYPRVHPAERNMLSSCGFSSQRKPTTEYRSPEDIEKLGSRRRHHRRFQVSPAEDLSTLSALVSCIRNIARPGCGKGEKMLILVNPFSGTQEGTSIFKNLAVPLFEEAGMDYDFLITKDYNHAFERMKEKATDSDTQDISNYDGVVAIGGDGIIHEMLQGIRTRSDSHEVLGKLKLGVIGSGTSNGLAKSLAYASDELDSALDYAFLVAKGSTVKMDLSEYQTKSASYLSFLSFSWSMIADIDIESEMIRFVGFLRMDLWGAWCVLKLRKYRARFSYLPPSADGASSARCPPLSDPIPSDGTWVTSEDDFVLFWASQVSHCAEKTFNSPGSTLDDGLFQILIVRYVIRPWKARMCFGSRNSDHPFLFHRGKVSRLRMAMILLGLDSGGHANMPGVEFIKCSAYRLEPVSPGSYNDLDGEVIEDGPVQGHVLPSAVKVFCTPKETRTSQ